MNELLKTYISLSVSGSILALLLFAIKPITNKKFTKQWHYYIWLIVILRLLIPFTPSHSITAPIYQYAGQIRTTYPILSDGLSSSSSASNDSLESREENRNNPLTRKSSLQNDWYTLTNSLWMIWLFVAALLFVKKVTSYYGFLRYVKIQTHKITDAHFLTIYHEEVKKAGLKRYPSIYLNPLVSSPMLVGIFRPFIVVTTLEQEDDALRYMFAHELTHYKRYDILYKWMVQLVLCFHWFNPFIHVISKEINKNCELSCDEAIIYHLNEKKRFQYGDTLLATLESSGSYYDAVASITLSENAKQLKERLSSILTFQKHSKRRIVYSIVLAFFLLCGAVSFGAYQNPSPNSNHKGIVSNSISPAYYHKTAMDTKRVSYDSPLTYQNVNITITDNSAVDFLVTDQNDISVEYDKSLYHTTMTYENGNWDIAISYIGSEAVYPSAIINLPVVAYEAVNLEVNDSTVSLEKVFETCNLLDATIQDSCVFYSLPDKLNGSVIMDADNCYFELQSDNSYQNLAVTLQNGGEYEDIPDGFIKQGDTLTYKNGTKKGNISIDFYTNASVLFK